MSLAGVVESSEVSDFDPKCLTWEYQLLLSEGRTKLSRKICAWNGKVIKWCLSHLSSDLPFIIPHFLYFPLPCKNNTVDINDAPAFYYLISLLMNSPCYRLHALLPLFYCLWLIMIINKLALVNILNAAYIGKNLVIISCILHYKNLWCIICLYLYKVYHIVPWGTFFFAH